MVSVAASHLPVCLLKGFNEVGGSPISGNFPLWARGSHFTRRVQMESMESPDKPLGNEQPSQYRSLPGWHATWLGTHPHHNDRTPSVSPRWNNQKEGIHSLQKSCQSEWSQKHCPEIGLKGVRHSGKAKGLFHYFQPTLKAIIIIVYIANIYHKYPLP